ncbi:SUN domain-containing protein 2 [Anguilla anguilla]|uniref:SUN domain-containing protein 2 n=1 Tax=Anguilla anguilla TaxID=7936 RepID=UPI0015B05127|nr:SUN domain-containing protein 2 [Anguilla anguilla]XP_035261357.1 SUN domain-containing protein 2 [Anguilla anguilla]XP_035261358.1 SUN domain-containing protein 2 [Anguilla anguilla]
MSRRSTRLGQYSQPDDDAASTSSTGSTSQISYRENPVRIFKKKTGGRRSGSRSSEVTARDSLSRYTDYDEPAAEEDWGSVERKATPPRKTASSFRTFGAEPLLSARESPALVSSLQEVQGHSSGYSSSEEGYYRPDLKSAQSPTEPEFGVKDVIRSPARVMAMLFWRLGSAWYALTSGLSLLDVFLLSRRTAAVRKAILLFLLLLFLAFAVWYWLPHLSSFFTLRAVKSKPGVSAPVRTVPQDVAVAPDLSALRDEINGRFVEREARWTEERERAMRAEERWREERGREQENLLRELALLKQDGEKLKLLSEMLKTEMRNLQQTVRSGDAEHRSRLGQETAGLDRQISDLRAELTSLHGATDLLQQRVDSQEANNAKLKAELSAWLLENLASGAPSAGLVLRPELQGALEDLEKKLLDRLAEDRVKNRGDAWRSVGETLRGEGAGAVTVQDVHQIVGRALSLYRADGIGMVDYALESSGASVVNTRCSETYRTRSACLSLFGIPLWYHSESPRTVIQPEVYPGKCWAFQGGQGFVVIALSYPVNITHVTLEHLPKTLSPTGRIDSAPKDFSVYGMSNEKDEGVFLGSFTYDQDGEPIQTFKLPDSLEGVYRMVELRILSNWGHLEYTCVYRFRVHGQPWTTEE